MSGAIGTHLLKLGVSYGGGPEPLHHGDPPLGRVGRRVLVALKTVTQLTLDTMRLKRPGRVEIRRPGSRVFQG